MTFDELRALQHGVFAVWQLVLLGWTEGQIRWAIQGLRKIHDGVFVTGDGPVTADQLHWAAVLTAPNTWLSHESHAYATGIIETAPKLITVTRRGSGGIQRYDDLLVHRSIRLPGAELSTVEGIPCLHPARTILDLVPARGDNAARRLVRNGLRRKVVTGQDLRTVVARQRGRRGSKRLRGYIDAYAHLRLERTKSDAEAVALALLDGAGRPAPMVNRVVDGGEADLAWPQFMLIIEIDEPYWHQFPEEDARKQARWEARGWRVERVLTKTIYDAPERFLALAPPPPKMNGGILLP